jgi:hypothetical protein
MSVSLTDGATYHATINEETLMETHLRIQEEAAELQEAAASLGPDPFAIPLAEVSVCRRCPFQGLCYPGGIAAARS